MTDRVGEQLGNYRLMRLLGRGGFAEVYLGEHIYLETTAAIKVLYARLSSEDADQFRNEARTIARLVHPHIVRVLEFGVEQEAPYLVVDYAPNGTLRKRYPRGSRLPLQTIVSYVNQLADALQYAHDHRVIHRDVKPENMLIGRRQEILLSDFGIALVTQTTQQSGQGIQEMAGTIAYMAPEQIQSHAVPASDQYALAVAVYEWLCGVRPFQGSFTEVAVKQTLIAPPPLREHVSELSAGVERVVLKALSKDPGQRYPTVMNFAQALEQEAQEAYLNSPQLTDPLRLVDTTGGLGTGRDATSSVAGMPPQDGVHGATLASAPVIAEEDARSTPDTADLESEQSLQTVPYIEMLPKIREAEAVQTTSGLLEEETNKALVEREGASSVVKMQMTEPIVTAGKLPRRAFVAGVVGISLIGLGGISWLALNEKLPRMSPDGLPVAANNEAILVYPGHTGIVWSAEWMPRGNSIASGSADYSVQVWDADRGIMKYTYTGHGDSVYSIAWSPDGKRIASASYDQTVQVWDAYTGYFPKTYSGHSSWVWVVAWSPDGRYIASAGGDKTVQVWDAESLKRLVTYTGHSDNVYALAWSPDSQYLASAGGDKTVQIWQALSLENVYTDSSYAATIWSVAWSPDGKRVAVGGNGRSVQVWNAQNGGNRLVYNGHKAFVYALAWSSNGNWIASAGEDHKVHLWKADDGQIITIYSGHSDAVRGLSWSPENARFVSASFDKSVRIWHIPG